MSSSNANKKRARGGASSNSSARTDPNVAEYNSLRLMVRGGFVVALIVIAGMEMFATGGMTAQADSDLRSNDTGPNPTLESPAKQFIPTIKIAEAVGWAKGATPQAMQGFGVNAFATDLDHPRWLHVLPNGDVLVAETNAPERKGGRKGLRGWFMKKAMKRAGAATPSANRITLLRDTNGDGVAESSTVFLKNLNAPFGMALVGNNLYVANSDAIVKYPYTPNATSIDAVGEKIVDLPAGELNHHWTKNILASADGKKLYATVGSNSNVAENGLLNEINRASILEVDLETKAIRVFASGLRNPNGLAWQPTTRELWTAVNERDEIGDNIVPDYIAAVSDGDYFGWPFSYYGMHMDARAPKAENSMPPAEVPDFALGSHTASLGLAFYDAGADKPHRFPSRFNRGAFIGQHGSWNRSHFAGYKVVFVPFDSSGRPLLPMEDFLTGFLDSDGRAHGRPVGVAVDSQGALLVADDVGNRIWRVIPTSTPIK